VRQLHDIKQADVPLPALDPAYIIPMKLSELRELFLRQVSLQSQLADALSEDDSRVGMRHLAILGM
jgi:hypothetical protein